MGKHSVRVENRLTKGKKHSCIGSRRGKHVDEHRQAFLAFTEDGPVLLDAKPEGPASLAGFSLSVAHASSLAAFNSEAIAPLLTEWSGCPLPATSAAGGAGAVGMPLRLAVCVAVECDGSVLITSRGPDAPVFPHVFVLPGGHVEHDAESEGVPLSEAHVRSAAVREVQEETGLVVDPNTLDLLVGYESVWFPEPEGSAPVHHLILYYSASLDVPQSTLRHSLPTASHAFEVDRILWLSARQLRRALTLVDPEDETPASGHSEDALDPLGHTSLFDDADAATGFRLLPPAPDDGRVRSSVLAAPRPGPRLVPIRMPLSAFSRSLSATGFTRDHIAFGTQVALHHWLREKATPGAQGGEGGVSKRPRMMG
jgi:8-oxo-dGTP pyrophosphatase MutT (NUDIX family)